MPWIVIDPAALDLFGQRTSAMSETVSASTNRIRAMSTTPGLGAMAGYAQQVAADAVLNVGIANLADVLLVLDSTLKANGLLASEQAGAAPAVGTVGAASPAAGVDPMSVFRNTPGARAVSLQDGSGYQEILVPDGAGGWRSVGKVSINEFMAVAAGTIGGNHDPIGGSVMTIGGPGAGMGGPMGPLLAMQRQMQDRIDAHAAAIKAANPAAAPIVDGMVADGRQKAISAILAPEPDEDRDGVRDSMDPKPYDSSIKYHSDLR